MLFDSMESIYGFTQKPSRSYPFLDPSFTSVFNLTFPQLLPALSMYGELPLFMLQLLITPCKCTVGFEEQEINNTRFVNGFLCLF